jgi:long-chain acyl-CoA synthetase
VGHGRPYLTALLALDPQAAQAWAAEHGQADMSLAALAADPRLRALVGAAVTAANEELPGAERIRQYTLVPDSWPLASDLLTATGKMRRGGIARHYAHVIDGMYERRPT